MLPRALLVGPVSFALALGGCAPEDEGKDEVPSVPLGYQLAAAQTDVGEDGVPLPGSNLAISEDLPDAADVAPRVVGLNVQQLEHARAFRPVRLIDVRRDDEVAEGMIPGAEHIAMDDFDPAEVLNGDGREIILYCRSGRRSALVAEQLIAHTGKSAIHLEGGIIAWEAAGLPVERSK